MGEFQSDFCDNLTEFHQNFLKILVCLADFSPQSMVCMDTSRQRVNEGLRKIWMTLLQLSRTMIVKQLV